MKKLSSILTVFVMLSGAALGFGPAKGAPLPLSTLASAPFAAPNIDRSMADATDPVELAPNLRRQLVAYAANVAPGTVIIDTAHTYLYYVLGGGRAIRYGIGVGRGGFTWSGVEQVTRKAEWPDWIPPAAMIVRQPYLVRWMAGGEGNPLGARAIYLGHTLYRIHGTNDPQTIGQDVSSGCIRLLNADVIDLYNRVNIGTKIIVLANNTAASKMAAPIPTNLRSRYMYRSDID